MSAEHLVDNWYWPVLPAAPPAPRRLPWPPAHLPGPALYILLLLRLAHGATGGCRAAGRAAGGCPRAGPGDCAGGHGGRRAAGRAAGGCPEQALADAQAAAAAAAQQAEPQADWFRPGPGCAEPAGGGRRCCCRRATRRRRTCGRWRAWSSSWSPATCSSIPAAAATTTGAAPPRAASSPTPSAQPVRRPSPRMPESTMVPPGRPHSAARMGRQLAPHPRVSLGAR